MERLTRATIKSFTSLEQSRKLADILSLESADMIYVHTVDLKGYEHYNIDFLNINPLFKDDICAWSLAALLEEIPEIINFDDDESNYALEILKEGDLYYLSYGNPLEGDKLNIEPQENFVDACVDMIEKLYELNLL